MRSMFIVSSHPYSSSRFLELLSVAALDSGPLEPLHRVLDKLACDIQTSDTLKVLEDWSPVHFQDTGLISVQPDIDTGKFST